MDRLVADTDPDPHHVAAERGACRLIHLVDVGDDGVGEQEAVSRERLHVADHHPAHLELVPGALGLVEVTREHAGLQPEVAVVDLGQGVVAETMVALAAPAWRQLSKSVWAWARAWAMTCATGARMA